MAIPQIHTLDSQVWNSDGDEFFRKNGKIIATTATDFVTSTTHPFILSQNFDGYYTLTGRITFSGVIAATGSRLFATLPAIFRDKVIIPTIVTQYVGNSADATGASDLLMGITISANREVRLEDRNQALGTDNLLYINLNFYTQ